MLLNPYRFSAGGGGVGFRYWRIYVTLAESAYWGAAEVAFKVGGVAQYGGTASADSTYSGLSPSAAFNGVAEGAYWANNATMPSWLMYDYGPGVSKDITEMTFTAQFYTTQGPKNFKVQCSNDGVAWVDRLTIVSAPAWGSYEARTFTIPPIAAAAHRYYRIDIGASQSNSTDHAVGDIELRATAGGPNLPITEGGSASASSALYYPASRAFDGLLPRSTNAWVTGGQTTPWIQWDFGVGNEQSVTECKVINSQTASGAEQNQHPRNFLVSYSDDGSTWTPCGRKFGASGASEASSTVALSESFVYDGYSRYRLYITAINGGTNCATASLELIDGNAYDVATGLSGNATASSNYPGESPNRAFDGTTSTTWATADGVGAPHWIDINVVLKAKLTSFALTNQNGLGNRMPRDFVLQGSNDGGSSWVDIKTVTGEIAWGDLERRVFTI